MRPISAQNLLTSNPNKTLHTPTTQPQKGCLACSYCFECTVLLQFCLCLVFLLFSSSLPLRVVAFQYNTLWVVLRINLRYHSKRKKKKKEAEKRKKNRLYIYCLKRNMYPRSICEVIHPFYKPQKSLYLIGKAIKVSKEVLN